MLRLISFKKKIFFFFSKPMKASHSNRTSQKLRKLSVFLNSVNPLNCRSVFKWPLEGNIVVLLQIIFGEFMLNYFSNLLTFSHRVL